MHRQDNTYHAFIPVVKHWLEREIAQCLHHEGLIRWPITPWQTFISQISLFYCVSIQKLTLGYFSFSRCFRIHKLWHMLSIWQMMHMNDILLLSRVTCGIHFSLIPASLHNWCNRLWYVLSCLWDGAYKRIKDTLQLMVAAGFLSSYLSGPIPYIQWQPTFLGPWSLNCYVITTSNNRVNEIWKVSVKYFDPLTYDSITNIALILIKTKNPSGPLCD